MLARRYSRLAAFLAACLAASSLAVGRATAADYSIGALRIGTPWTRVTPKGASVAGGYMTITNNGSAPDRLVGGTAAVAERFEVHATMMEQGVARMRPVAGGLVIGPGETVELKPGSTHAMFVGLKRPLQKGQNVKGTLKFEKAGSVEIEYAVEALGATSPAAGAAHRH